MTAKVYFVKARAEEGEKLISKKAVQLFNAAGFAKCFKENDFTAVKVHVGEKGNTTYIRPGCIRGLVSELVNLKAKPFLTDTSTLYVQHRSNAIDHAKLAHDHGFSIENLGVPFIPPDGLFGTSETSVEINCPLNREVFIAYDIVRCQSILSVAHFTGHMATCAGATLKTLGMGCSSRKGKMRQHAALKPSVTDKCTLCGECSKHCPSDAITLGDVQAHIDQDKCIGCAECVAVCRFKAVKYDWGAENKILQQNVAEHALGVLKGKHNRAAFFNFVMSVTKDCDCFGDADMPRIVEDVGIFASADAVAVDKASLDAIEARGGKKLSQLIGNKQLNPDWQLEHAERIGLGSREYKLVEIGR